MTNITLEELLEKQKVETADSQLVIQMPDQKLKVGKHLFNLTVEDDSGNVSSPAQITVIVVDTAAPTAVLDLHDAQGKTVSDGQISFGSGFILSGKNSVDIGGTVAKYVWEVVPQ
ncbi:MAG: hypothetical protein HKN34_12295 [Gammaproteobacteria bacterium]|nr:hypothetical protein [Gammaproteobacteria bacterium]